jgi:hypothetical protein
LIVVAAAAAARCRGGFGGGFFMRPAANACIGAPSASAASCSGQTPNGDGGWSVDYPRADINLTYRLGAPAVSDASGTARTSSFS